MPWTQTGATQYNAMLVFQTKVSQSKGCLSNDWNLEPLDLQKDLALGCKQPSAEV